MTRSVRSAPYLSLLEALVAARRNAGMCQADLALALGRPQSFVSKYEHGERRLDVVELLEISIALDADPESLIRPTLEVLKRQKPA